MKLLLFFLVAVSCASKTPLPKAIVKEIPVKTHDEARKIIQNRQRYLELLFENNEAPVYVEKKWTAQCLKENKIGTVAENGKQVTLISELYLDPSNHEGHCSDKFYAHKAYVIYVYCEKTSKVLDIRFPYDDKFKLNQRDLCL